MRTTELTYQWLNLNNPIDDYKAFNKQKNKNIGTIGKMINRLKVTDKVNRLNFSGGRHCEIKISQHHA